MNCQRQVSLVYRVGGDVDASLARLHTCAEVFSGIQDFYQNIQYLKDEFPDLKIAFLIRNHQCLR